MSLTQLIMLVEDNHDIRDSIASILEVNGYEVVSAADGNDALEKLDELHRIPDLIVSDIRMPVMSGYEFLEQVRSQDRYYSVPFIFLTALGEDHQVAYGWEKGVDAYIVKPFQPERLIATIRNRIKRNQQTQQFAERQISRTRHVLLQVLSHELRTPLTYVMGGISLLEDVLGSYGVPEDEVETFTGVIMSGADRLLRLADQTSTLGELMSGYLMSHWDEVSEPLILHGIVQTSMEKLEADAKEKDITFETEFDSSIYIFGIEHMLAKGVYEVIHNSIQFSDKGATITIKTYRQDDKAIIEVHDTGRGILPEDVERIWEVMRQSEREKYEHQGLGLGLTLTKGIFEAHEGDARIDSKHGEYTTVYMELPEYHSR